MANYRKSFNLRNGVQVDDDNFIVNANGLVGIGTSSPTEFLDVRGNAKIVGLVTANNLYAGIATVGFITATQGLSVSGVLTATTFSGSAAGLTGIYAIAVDGWYITSSGVSTTSNVGVGTTNPQGAFQVGTGATIYSTGDAKYTGIITASSFIGNVVGNLNGNVIGNLTGNVSSSGVSTLTTLLVGTAITATSGIVSATTFVGNLTGNVTGSLAGNATGLSGTPNLNVGIVTASKIIADVVEVPNTGITTVSKLLHVGTGGTAFAALNSGRIGVGTALPTSELQIRKASGSLLEVISDSGSARISIGQSVGVGKSTGVIRFGDTDRTLDIINRDTGNINYYLHAGDPGIGTGRFDWLYGQTNAQLMSLTYDGKLGLGITNPTTNLHVVGTSTVTGNAFFGGNITVNGTLSATSLSLSTLTGTLLGNVYSTSGVSTFANVLVSSGSSLGIGTTSPISALDSRNGTGLFQSIGIGTDSVGANNVCFIDGSIAITPVGYIGIGTTAPIDLTPNPDFGQIQLYSRTIDMNNSLLNVKNTGAIGFNTYTARSVFDYGRVGSATINPYMILPNVTTAVRAGLAQTVEGAIIYNSTTKKHQGYGSTDGGVTFSWNDLY